MSGETVMHSNGDRQLPFSPGEFGRRLCRVRDAAAARNLDALFLTTPENVYYLTGFETAGGFYVSHHSLVVPIEGEPCLVARYGERSNVWARSWLQSQHTELYRDTEDPAEAVTHALERAKAKRIGVEKGSWLLTVALYERLAARLPDADLADCSGLVEQLRMIKSPEELAYVEAAAKISNAAMSAGIAAIAEGKTDRDIVAAAYRAAVLAGSEYESDMPGVTVGPRTALFHATWSGQPIRRGDVVFMDFTGVVKRYLAPIARSASLGPPPAYIPDRVKILLESLQTGIAAMRPGVTCAQVYEAFVAPVVKAGYEVPIKVGYSVGASFPPRRVECDGLNLLPDNHTVLQPGMVIHTPRTIRVPGEQTPIFGETTLITERGHTVLTSGPLELVPR